MAITYHAGRRIQGLDSEKPIDASTTEFYDQAIGNGSLDLYTDIPRLGVKAVSGNGTGHINKIKVWLRVIGTHTSTNPVYARVRKISDDSIVATATKTIADLTSGTTITEYEFDFGSCVEITSAEHYVLIEYAYGDASNYLGLTRYSGAVTGWEWTSYNGSSYTTNSTQSLSGTFSSQVGHVCSSGDVQVGSRFEATDTRKMYHYESPSVTFEDDYTSNSGWTQTGSKVTVDSGKLDWVDANAAATNDSLQQVIKSLGITLSDTAWTTDFIYINNGGTVGGHPFIFQSGTGNYDTASNDAIAMLENNPNQIKINTKNGGTNVAGSSTIAVSSGTTYYIRIQRTSATDIKLSAFTDSARTTHTSGSPVTVSNAGIANITGLTYVQHQNQTSGGGGTTNFEVTDLKIYNGVTSTDNAWSELGT